MRMKLQKINIDFEKIDVIHNANEECPEQRSGSRPDSPASQYQPPVNAMPDREYVILMEERYGIREEGIF